MRLSRLDHAAIMGVAMTILIAATTAMATDTPAETVRPGPINPLAGLTIDDLSDRAMLVTATEAASDPVLVAGLSDESVYEENIYGHKTKSPRRAFLQSLLIPGWGQWYNGNRLKPFLFLGLEAAGWAGWNNYRSSGKDKETEYRIFADAHWDSARYFDGLTAVFYQGRGDLPEDRRYIDTTTYTFIRDGVVFNQIFSHHAYFGPDGKEMERNTYYENVGKYDQFAYGWDDFKNGEAVQSPDDTIGVNFLTPNRRTYVKMRDAANREFSHASTVLILTLGNHLLSAFEAAVGARRYNRALDQFGSVDANLRLTQSPASGKLEPRMTVSYHF